MIWFFSFSPIYTHFTETSKLTLDYVRSRYLDSMRTNENFYSVQGIPTIRSMRAGNRFHRDFLVKLEESIRAQLTASAAQQWLGLRLQLLGAFFVGGSGFVAVITSSHSDTPELTGLVISYTLSFVSILSGVLSALTETEQVMNISNQHKLYRKIVIYVGINPIYCVFRS